MLYSMGVVAAKAVSQLCLITMTDGKGQLLWEKAQLVRLILYMVEVLSFGGNSSGSGSTREGACWGYTSQSHLLPRSPYLGAGAWVINIDQVGNFHFLKHDQKTQPQG